MARRTETVIAVDLTRKIVLIGGTSYAGEMKKSVFTVLNYLLPAQGRDADALLGQCRAATATPPCSSACPAPARRRCRPIPTRTLIGDDEHGWGPDGIFNFEGGCYAKTIRLSAEAEPEIFATTQRFGTVLENVVLDAQPRARLRRRLADRKHPLRLSAATSSRMPARPAAPAIPKNIIMLTADAFGVMPPIARLTPGAGDVPLPVRLHRQGRRHRAGRDRAGSDLLDLLRRALHAAPSVANTATCCAS